MKRIEMKKYIIDSETEGMRMDRLLKKICRSESLGRIFEAIRKGNVKVNGKKTKENYRLKLNDEITVKFLNTENADTQLKIDKKIRQKTVADEKKYREMIIFENEDFFIVNKSGNIPMHKGTGHGFGLSEVFKQIYGNQNINFANRLDLETSGLVIGCKNLKFLRYISEKIRNDEVRKKYVAVVHGNIIKEKFTIESYLATTERGVETVTDKSRKNAKKSRTDFKKIKPFKDIRFSKTTFLDIDLITGRKHQIRVQLSNAGNPIVGDKKYGNNDKSEILYLNCYFISFDEFEFELEKDKIWN